MKIWLDIADKFPIKFEVQRMLEEIKVIEDGQWLEHYDPTLSRGWKAIPLISLDGRMGNAEDQRPGSWEQFKPSPILERLPYFKEVLEAFKCSKGRCRILKLMPGAGIDKHRDAGQEVANLAFNKVRLHIPFQTNPDVFFYVDNERIQMKLGGLYYVNFSKVHWVKNDGKEVRLHLVLDLEVNDWLWQYFPKPTLVDRVWFLIQRITLPVFWELRQITIKLHGLAWHAWKGSTLQKWKKALWE